jgi:predicted kinase
MDKTLYIIRGLPGSGKTTLAQILAPLCNVAADDFMVDEVGNYSFDPERLGEVHQACEQQAFMWMEQDQPVIAVHNTFGQLAHITPYVEMADRYHYTVFIIEAQGGFLSKHAVPDSTLKRMVACWDDTKTLFYERLLGTFKG